MEIRSNAKASELRRKGVPGKFNDLGFLLDSCPPSKMSICAIRTQLIRKIHLGKSQKGLMKLPFLSYIREKKT